MDKNLITARLAEIQIENEPPFVPEEIINIGRVYGIKEQTKPGDKVRNYRLSSYYATIHYVYEGLETQEFYRRGEWVRGTNSVPRFCVKGLLSDE